MKSIHRPDFFDNQTFNKIRDCVFKKIKDVDLAYGKEFQRYYRVVFLTDEIKDILLNRAKEEIKDDSLELIYTQIVKYQIKDGQIPELRKHKDIVTGEWVMDIVIDGTVDWPIIIEDQSFSNIPNSVTFIRGEEESHWRPDFPSESEEDYILLLFVHLAKRDGQFAKSSREFFGMGEERVTAFLRSADPGWGKNYTV